MMSNKNVQDQIVEIDKQLIEVERVLLKLMAAKDVDGIREYMSQHDQLVEAKALLRKNELGKQQDITGDTEMISIDEIE